jgi:hypothetical protein
LDDTGKIVFVVCSGLSQHCIASSISLLRGLEVDEILDGHDEKYKAVSVHSFEQPTVRYDGEEDFFS